MLKSDIPRYENHVGAEQRQMTARQRFEAIAALADTEINIAEAALVIAQEEYPQLDIAAYLARFDQLAAEVTPLIAPEASPTERIQTLNTFLFEHCKFTGNHDAYDDPRNSYLHTVLDRRIGIPITLSIIYCEVARRIGLPIYGVNFPGHFLVRHVGDPDVLIDPFFSTTVTHEECAQRFTQLYGHRVPYDARVLTPAPPRVIIVRVLRNLKLLYVRTEDFSRALACADRILLLAPDTPAELRDRGILYQRLECYSAALQDLERYMQLAPNGEHAADVHVLLPVLRRQVEKLH